MKNDFFSVRFLLSVCSLFFVVSNLCVQSQHCAKKMRKVPRFTFALMPKEIKQHIFAMVMGNRIAHAQKVVRILGCVSKDIKHAATNLSPTICVPFALVRLFEYAQKGDLKKLRYCFSFLVRKNYRIDQLALSRDLSGKTLGDYLVDLHGAKDIIKQICSRYYAYVDVQKFYKKTLKIAGVSLRLLNVAWINLPLSKAVQEANIERVSKILQTGVHPDIGSPLAKLERAIAWSKSIHCIRAFDIACKKNLTEIALLLIDYGASVESQEAIQSVCIHNNMTLLRAILSKRNSEKFKSNLYFSGLPKVREMNLFEAEIAMCYFFDEQFLDECVARKIINVNSLFIPAIACGAQQKLISFLCKHNVNMGYNKAYQTTPLIIAADRGFVWLVKLLLKNGVDVNCTDRKGYSALSFSEAGNRTKISRLLRKAGASEDFKKKEKQIFFPIWE